MKENDLVLCKVEKVTNTITFVRLPNGKQGTIISPEIAPGRIKFMRQYVVPNKQIVCKILEILGDNIHLSLRRVNSKEKKEVMQKFKQEQAINVAFKQILGERLEEINKEILKEFTTLSEFIDAAKHDEKLITNYVPKVNQESIQKLTEKGKTNLELKQNILIKCLEDDGIKRIKKVFEIEDKNISITYIAAGQFKLKLQTENFKEGKNQMTEILEEFEKRAKENNCEFFATDEK